MVRAKSLNHELMEASVRSASAEVERRVAAGETDVCETVLAAFPAIAASPDGVLELIYLEYVLRAERGEQQEIGIYADRFPGYFEDFKCLLQVDEAMRVSSTTSERSTIHSRSATDTHGVRPGTERSWSGIVGDYFLLEVLGRGGMGVVYRARQNRLNRIVAVKTLDAFARLDSTTLARFQVEAELAARLQHPNIVQIYEVGTHASTPYFSMELVSGGNLQDATRERPLQPAVAARIMATLSQAVQYAHSQGIIHRDLKPANILLAPSDRSEAIDLRPGEFLSEGELAHRVEIKIADFGLAKHLDAEDQRTQTGAAIGTPSYMAPEQIQGDVAGVGPASDIYSIGAILYYLLVGRPPFHAATVLETLHQVGNDDPVSPRKLQSHVPRDLETICLTCLQKEPHRRYASASELANDLNRFLDGKPIHARSAGPVEKASKWTRRNPSLTALLVSILVATMTITWLWRRAESSSVIANEARNKAHHLVYARDISLAHFEYQSHHVERCQEILNNCPAESRNWEWNYLKSLCKEHVWKSPSAGAPVLSLAMSPDGRYAAGSYGIWGIDQVEPVRVWDTESNKLLWELNGHSGCVHSVNFSPDGSCLISSAAVWGSADHKKGRRGGVKVWNLADGTPRLALDNVSAVASCYLPDGKSILVGTDTGEIIQYDSNTGEKIRRFIGHSRSILDLAMNSQGDYFASTAKDFSLRLWNLKTGQLMNNLKLSVDPFQVDWSPNGKQLVVGGWSGEFLSYEVSNTSLRALGIQIRKGLPIVKYSPDGQYLVTAVFGEGADLKDTQRTEVLQRFHGHNGNIRAVAFDGAGSKLATGGSDGCIQVWDLTKPERSITKASTNGPSVAAIASNPARPEIAIALKNNEHRGDSVKQLPRIELRNPTTMKLIRELDGHSDWITCIDYRSDGTQLISGSADKSVRLWDVATGNQSQEWIGHEHPIVGVAIFDQDKKAVSVDQQGLFKVWSLASGSLELEWHMSNETVTSMSCCANRSILAVGTASGSVSIWNVRDGAMLSSREGDAGISHLRFSPDGKFIALTKEKSSVIEVWKSADLMSNSSASAVATLLAGNVDVVNSISFSADSRRLVSSGRDESVRIYDHALGHELLNLHIARGINNVIHFGSSGELIYSEENRLYCLAPNVRRNSESGPGADGAVDWHNQQVSHATRKEDWYASVFHQSRLLELAPPTAKLLFNNGVQRAYLGDYDGAERELREALELKDLATTRSYLALVCLRNGEVDDYKELCRRMMDDAKQSVKLNDVNTAVWASSISEYSGIDATLCLEMMATAIANSAQNNKLSIASRASYENTLALVHFRANQFQEAIDHANESLKLGSVAPMVDYTILSMCYSKLNQSEKAKSQLVLATRAVSKNRRIVEAGLKLSSTVRNLEAFEFSSLLREATELVQKDNRKSGDSTATSTSFP